MDNVYDSNEPVLTAVSDEFLHRLKKLNAKRFEETGEHLYEHVISRIKSEKSMNEKLVRRNLPVTRDSALHKLKDAIGIRIVCSFIDDIYDITDMVAGFDHCTIVEEKDYIRHAKPNGYRSYHLILELEKDFLPEDSMDAAADLRGGMHDIGELFPLYAEVQLRTIAMDSWAALEHRMKYKKDIQNQELLVSELKRCADELNGCDLSMQTIRDLIRGG